MWVTNLKIAAVVIGTLAFYTMLANSIPQLQSEVPKQLGGNLSPEEMVAAGQDLYNGAGGCTACHGLGTRAPNLLTDERGTGQIGARCATREAGTSCKEYLHEALVQPGKFVAPGFQPIMPDMSKTLSATQIWALIAFLESQGGTVDVSASDLPAASSDSDDDGEATATAGFAGGSTEPVTMLRDGGCFGCHKLGDEGAEVGPNLSQVGARANAAAIRQSILDPDAKVATGFETMKGIMPKGLGDQMTATQLEALVSFLASRK